jgi:hypothetical protein
MRNGKHLLMLAQLGILCGELGPAGELLPASAVRVGSASCGNISEIGGLLIPSRSENVSVDFKT